MSTFRRGGTWPCSLSPTIIKQGHHPTVQSYLNMRVKQTFTNGKSIYLFLWDQLWSESTIESNDWNHTLSTFPNLARMKLIALLCRDMRVCLEDKLMNYLWYCKFSCSLGWYHNLSIINMPGLGYSHKGLRPRPRSFILLLRLSHSAFALHRLWHDLSFWRPGAMYSHEPKHNHNTA